MIDIFKKTQKDTIAEISKIIDCVCGRSCKRRRQDKFMQYSCPCDCNAKIRLRELGKELDLVAQQIKKIKKGEKNEHNQK